MSNENIEGRKSMGEINELLIVKLIEEVEFLREELRSRREDFVQREKSLLAIINILDSDRVRASNVVELPDEISAAENAKFQPASTKHTGRNNRGIVNAQPALSTSNRFDSLANTGETASPHSSRENAPLPRAPLSTTNVTTRRQKTAKKSRPTVDTVDSPVHPTTATPAVTDVVERTEQTGGRRNAGRRRKIVILGDSTLKDLAGWKMSKTHQITCHSLSGCNNSELLHLSRALCERKPDILILGCGTNSMYPKIDPVTKQPTNIPMSPEEVATSLKNCCEVLNTEYPAVKVIISNLITRADHGDEGKAKITETNDFIASCNLPHIEHVNIDESHLNSSKLHLNRSGTSLLAQNFINFIRTYDFDE